VAVSPSSVRVDVPTDALTLVVLVVNTGTPDDWRVAGYDRAEPAAPGAPAAPTAAPPQPGR
jgi:hypothetical protein